MFNYEIIYPFFIFRFGFIFVFEFIDWLDVFCWILFTLLLLFVLLLLLASTDVFFFVFTTTPTLHVPYGLCP